MKRQQNNCFPISRIKCRTNHSHMCSSPKLNREKKTRKKKEEEEMLHAVEGSYVPVCSLAAEICLSNSKIE